MSRSEKFYKDVFISLGRELEHFGETADTSIVIEAAVAANPWFNRAEIIHAVEALRVRMLSRNVLEEWERRCPATANPGKRVAVIMAGNVPLVGFSDLLCVLWAGHVPYVKPSSKDTALMDYIVSLLGSVEPVVTIERYRPDEGYDAVIASGSDNTGRFFRSQFADTPSIIRGSRSSVALLRGNETAEQLRLLGRDMFLYSGLGCRNVSLVLAPEDYDFEQFGRAVATTRGNVNSRYYNNYRSTLGRLSVEREPFIDCGTFVITFGAVFPTYISNIVAFRYRDISEAYTWLQVNDAAIQCVVGDNVDHSRAVCFGESQLPRPWDYPDGEDVMEFLAAL